MAGLDSMLGSSFGNVQALMSPEFNKVLDNRLACKNNNMKADSSIANMSISEALQSGIGGSESQVQPVYQAPQVYQQPQQAQPQMIQQAPALKAGVITEARDFSYLDGSNMKFEPEKEIQEPTITPDMIRESNLPDFMKQSFLEEPPVQGVLPKDNVDVFAEALIAKGVIPKPQQKQAPVQQAQAPVQKRQQLRENRSVDDTKDQEHYYDYQSSDIKAMLEDIVKKQMNVLYKQLKKDMVSVANQIVDNCAGNSLTTIKIGDSLRFVDGEGNVFEADLHFVGNKKQK